MKMVLNVSFSYYTFFSYPWFIRDNERTGKSFICKRKTGAVITRADLDLPSDGIMISQQEYDKMLKIIADYEAGKLGGSGVEFEKVKGDEEINA